MNMFRSRDYMYGVVRKKFGAVPKDCLFWKENMTQPSCKSKDVIVEMDYAGFSGLDIQFRRGNESFLRKIARSVPGLEGSGVVAKVGKKVKRFNSGDLVCGYSIQSGGFGTYAQYSKFPESNVAKIPKSSTLKETGILPISLLMAYEFYRVILNMPEEENEQPSIEKCKDMLKGKSIVVLGAAGCVGMCTVALGKHLFGAERVYGVASRVTSEALLTQLGCDKIIDYKDVDAVKALLLPPEPSSSEEQEEVKKDVVFAVLDTHGSGLEALYPGMAPGQHFCSTILPGSQSGFFGGMVRGLLRRVSKKKAQHHEIFCREEKGFLLQTLLGIWNDDLGLGGKIAVTEFPLNQTIMVHNLYESGHSKPPGRMVLKVRNEFDDPNDLLPPVAVKKSPKKTKKKDVKKKGKEDVKKKVDGEEEKEIVVKDVVREPQMEMHEKESQTQVSSESSTTTSTTTTETERDEWYVSDSEHICEHCAWFWEHFWFRRYLWLLNLIMAEDLWEDLFEDEVSDSSSDEDSSEDESSSSSSSDEYGMGFPFGGDLDDLDDSSSDSSSDDEDDVFDLYDDSSDSDFEMF